MTLHEFFRTQEIAYWTELMGRVGGDVHAAAREASVHKSTVWKRLRDLNLDLVRQSRYRRKLEQETAKRVSLRRFVARSQPRAALSE